MMPTGYSWDEATGFIWLAGDVVIFGQSAADGGSLADAALAASNHETAFAAAAAAAAARAAALAALADPITARTVTGSTVAAVKASADAAIKDIAAQTEARLSAIAEALGGD
jgi:hypothetical protein